jgi:hypothetical protein
MVGLALGLLMVYAGAKKHLAAFSFAETIMAYRLLPESLVGVTAAVLPWVEITSGSILALGYVLEAWGRLALALGRSGGGLLLGGIKRRSCLLLIMGQMALFIVVLLITWARGIKIDCGCGLVFQREVGLIPILEDVGLLSVAAGLFWQEWPEAAAETGKGKKPRRTGLTLR